MSYTGRVTIVRPVITEAYSNELKAVRINLQWVSAGVLRNREMQTLVTRNGLQNYIY